MLGLSVAKAAKWHRILKLEAETLTFTSMGYLRPPYMLGMVQEYRPQNTEVHFATQADSAACL